MLAAVGCRRAFGPFGLATAPALPLACSLACLEHPVHPGGFVFLAWIGLFAGQVPLGHLEGFGQPEVIERPVKFVRPAYFAQIACSPPV